jgi:hypothetical protein
MRSDITIDRSSEGPGPPAQSGRPLKLRKSLHAFFCGITTRDGIAGGISQKLITIWAPPSADRSTVISPPCARTT